MSENYLKYGRKYSFSNDCGCNNTAENNSLLDLKSFINSAEYTQINSKYGVTKNNINFVQSGGVIIISDLNTQSEVAVTVAKNNKRLSFIVNATVNSSSRTIAVSVKTLDNVAFFGVNISSNGVNRVLVPVNHDIARAYGNFESCWTGQLNSVFGDDNYVDDVLTLASWPGAFGGMLAWCAYDQLFL